MAKGLMMGTIGQQGASSLGLTLGFEPSIIIAARRIERLGLDIRSFKEPLTRAIKQVMIPSFQKNFAVGGRPTWEPLAPATIDIHNRYWQGANSDPLMLTQALYRAAQQFSIWHVDKGEAMISDLPSKVFYGKFHQAGVLGRKKQIAKVLSTTGMTHSEMAQSMKSKGIKGIMPARPFFLFQPEDKQDVEQVFTDWLDERVAVAAGKGYFVHTAFHPRAF